MDDGSVPCQRRAQHQFPGEASVGTRCKQVEVPQDMCPCGQFCREQDPGSWERWTRCHCGVRGGNMKGAALSQHIFFLFIYWSLVRKRKDRLLIIVHPYCWHGSFQCCQHKEIAGKRNYQILNIDHGNWRAHTYTRSRARTHNCL